MLDRWLGYAVPIATTWAAHIQPPEDKLFGWLTSGWAQVILGVGAFIVAGLGLFAAWKQIKMSLHDLRDTQLNMGAHGPVQMAQELNALQVQTQVIRNALDHDRRAKRIREMHLDLADVVSESRRTAGLVVDFAGWENYFVSLLDQPLYSESLREAEGWYTDQVYALFRRLYVRNTQSLAVIDRIIIQRPAGCTEAWPSSLGEWCFYQADKNWKPKPHPIAFAALTVGTGKFAGQVAVTWSNSITTADEAEIRSWVAWHLYEGGVVAARWSERIPGARGWTYSVLISPRDRPWMDGEGTARFQVPKYSIRRTSFPFYLLPRSIAMKVALSEL